MELLPKRMEKKPLKVHPVTVHAPYTGKYTFKRDLIDKYLAEQEGRSFSFVEMKMNPFLMVTQKLNQLVPYLEVGTEIDFWEALIKYVVPDASVQEYTYGPVRNVNLRHHSFGDNIIELYPDGGIRGCANIVRIVGFFNAANVKFMAT